MAQTSVLFLNEKKAHNFKNFEEREKGIQSIRAIIKPKLLFPSSNEKWKWGMVWYIIRLRRESLPFLLSYPFPWGKLPTFGGDDKVRVSFKLSFILFYTKNNKNNIFGCKLKSWMGPNLENKEVEKLEWC